MLGSVDTHGGETTQISEPLGDAKHNWQWQETKKAWVCETIVAVTNPATLGPLIAYGWEVTHFLYSSVSETDARSECQSAELRYVWQTSKLFLKAYFKKETYRGYQIKH